MNFSLLQADSIKEFGFTFGNLRLEPDGTLINSDEAIHLTPKELAALRILLANPNRIVTAAQLKEMLWPDVYVTADSVPRCISSLRSRLGADVNIRTIYKRGYRLESPVHRYSSSQPDNLPRLAIVPFEVAMFVPEHLGVAFAEEAAAHLASVQPPTVRLLAHESVLTLAGTGLSALEIGKKVGADLVLSGTLQASALFLRLRAEMIRVEDGAAIWVEDFVASREHPAILQQRLSDRLCYRLGRHLPVSLAPFVSAAESTEPDPAYDAFLEARFESHIREPHRMQHAMNLLRKSADLNRNNLAVFEQLVRVSTDQCLYGYVSPAEAAEQIRRAADSFPETGHASTTILPALGWLLFHVEHQLPFAMRMLNEESPSGFDSWSNGLRIMLAMSRGRFDEARDLLDEALCDDPYAPSLHAHLAWAHHLAGCVTESIAQAQRCLDLFPGDERSELFAALILAFNNDADRAADLAHQVVQRRPSLDFAAAVEAYALARTDRRREASAILERLQWLGRERYVMRSFTAAAYAELGDIASALGELQAAEQAHCPWFFQVLADPRLTRLHGDPQFDGMRRRLVTMENSLPPEVACFS